MPSSETSPLIPPDEDAPAKCACPLSVFRYPLFLIIILLLPPALFATPRRPLPLPTLPSVPPLSPRTIRLLTLNTFIRPMLVGVNDHKDARLNSLLPLLSPFDLLCFQEIFTSAGPRHAQFLKSLKSQYFMHIAQPPTLSPSLIQLPPKLFDPGLLIASRRPLTRVKFHQYKACAATTVDCLVAKGVLYARLKINSRFVHVFCTHLQADDDGPSRHVVRIKQLKELVSFVRHVTQDDPGGPLVLAGDFNVNARAGFNNATSSTDYTRALRVLRGLDPALRDVLYDAAGEHPVTSAGGIKGKMQKNERLDYIFVGRVGGANQKSVRAVQDSVAVLEFRVEGKGYDTVSDHYGVKADIRIL